MEYHNHLFETHGNNNLLSRFGEFDISKYPMYSTQGEKNFIDDIYDNIDELEEIEEPEEPEEIKIPEEIITPENVPVIEPEPKEEVKIEEFTQLKQLLNNQLKERKQEKMLIFTIIIGICIILLINNKKH